MPSSCCNKRKILFQSLIGINTQPVSDYFSMSNKPGVLLPPDKSYRAIHPLPLERQLLDRLVRSPYWQLLVMVVLLD